MAKLNLHATIASGDSLDVRQYSVAERMSSLFEIALVVVSDNADIDFESVIGGAASFSMAGGFDAAPVTRSWTGVCTEAHQIAVEETGLSTYHLVIHP